MSEPFTPTTVEAFAGVNIYNLTLNQDPSGNWQLFISLNNRDRNKLKFGIHLKIDTVAPVATTDLDKILNVLNFMLTGITNLISELENDRIELLQSEKRLILENTTETQLLNTLARGIDMREVNQSLKTATSYEDKKEILIGITNVFKSNLESQISRTQALIARKSKNNPTS